MFEAPCSAINVKGTSSASGATTIASAGIEPRETKTGVGPEPLPLPKREAEDAEYELTGAAWTASAPQPVAASAAKITAKDSRMRLGRRWRGMYSPASRLCEDVLLYRAPVEVQTPSDLAVGLVRAELLSLGLGVLFTVASSFSLSKTVRDNHEIQRLESLNRAAPTPARPGPGGYRDNTYPSAA